MNNRKFCHSRAKVIKSRSGIKMILVVSVLQVEVRPERAGASCAFQGPECNTRSYNSERAQPSRIPNAIPDPIIANGRSLPGSRMQKSALYMKRAQQSWRLPYVPEAACYYYSSGVHGKRNTQ